MECAICERPYTEQTPGMVISNPFTGQRKCLCGNCLSNIMYAIQEGMLSQQQDGECDHFHEGDGKEIASDVERFYKGLS